jgi:hypothetical protein
MDGTGEEIRKHVLANTRLDISSRLMNTLLGQRFLAVPLCFLRTTLQHMFVFEDRVRDEG